jgi:hypothetical protein
MDKIKHWLKDVRGDLACSVKQMYYTNENIKIQKNISIFTFSKKHTEMFMMKTVIMELQQPTALLFRWDKFPDAKESVI